MNYKNTKKHSENYLRSPKIARYVHFGLLFNILLCILVLNKNLPNEKGSKMQATLSGLEGKGDTTDFCQFIKRENRTFRSKRVVKPIAAAIIRKRKQGIRRK